MRPSRRDGETVVSRFVCSPTSFIYTRSRRGLPADTIGDAGGAPARGEQSRKRQKKRRSAAMFSRRLSLSALIELCRVLRHYLGAGLSLPQVFRQQERRGPATVRAAAARIAGRLEGGDALETALKDEE